MTKTCVVHNSEGFGMPLVEAAACGVPVFAVDYSAMCDVVRKLEGHPVPVKRLYRESETHCWRALPDNNAFVGQLIRFLSLPEPLRARKGYLARKAVETHYTYERTAKIWEDHLDTVEIRENTWDSPARLHQPNGNVPPGLSNDQFVAWCIQHVAGRPELLGSYMQLRMTRDLNWGVTLPSMGGLYFNEASTLGTQPRFQDFDRERCFREMVKLCEQKNVWEKRRVNHVS